jgi:hypothetical protein
MGGDRTMCTRHDRWWKLLLPILVFGLASAGAARVLHVPGQYATIGAAVGAAADCDTVLVGPGLYEETLYVAQFLTLVSEDGPESTIIDGGGSSYAVVSFAEGLLGHNPDYWAIEGFTVQHGRDGIDAGFAAGSWFTVRDCIVRENSSMGIVAHERIAATVEQCTIVHNGAYGICLDYGHTPLPTLISENLIAFNYSGICGNPDAGAAIEHNTIVSNTSDGVHLVRGSDPWGTILLSSNIIAGNGRYGLRVLYGLWCPNAHHNDIWGNGSEEVASGSDCWDGVLGFNGNFSDDPLFCNVAGEDFTLSTVSPCVGTGAGGTDIGAFGVGCEPGSSVTEWEPRSWGTIKALYR